MKKIMFLLSVSILGCTGIHQAEKQIVLRKSNNGFLVALSSPLGGSRETVLRDVYHAIPQPDICPQNVLVHPISVQNGYTFGWTRGIGIFEHKTYKYWYIVAFLPYPKNDSLEVLKVVETNCCNPSSYRIVYRDSTQKTKQYVLNDRGKYIEMKAI